MADKRLESWMLDVKRLFQVWPHDMDVERAYNETCAEVEPYCSMCQLFRQVRQPSAVCKPHPGALESV